ncbi:MAG: hypothetical protein E7622_03825 [Ruminococcaceae bacterium]|nr:hypothetical protein [Oscillospiraceae bacterium]
MKGTLRKVFLVTIIMAFFALCFAICSSAASYTITYYQGDTAKLKEIHSDTEEITLRESKYSNRSETFYGWCSDDGVIYAPGSKITLTRDMKVYEACGKIANTEAEMISYFNDSNWTYIKLGKDMNIQERLPAYNGWQVHVLDLNGHNLTITNSEWGTGGTRNGVVFVGQGTINFTSTKPDSGAFYQSAIHGYGDTGVTTAPQRLWIGKNVKIISNVPLIRTTNDFTNLSPVPFFELWGDVTCPYLVWTQGIDEVDANIYPTARVNITDTKYPLLRDVSAYDDVEIMGLNIYGGTFTFPNGFKGFITDDEDLKECFPITIAGGTFNMDVAKYISVDYKTVDNGNGTYSIEPNICPVSPTQKHKYLATDITVSCEEDGHIDYKCEYCNDEYTSQRFALGHNTITLKLSDMKNTKKETVAGQYSHTCSRCGNVEYTYFFPDPYKAYITVKVKYEREGVTKTDTLRVKGEELFGYSIDTDSDEEGETYLTSFGTVGLQYTFDDGREEKFKMSEIVAVEIPLGTTKIQGNSAVFRENNHIQEISIPLSVEIVENNAFRDMPNLAKVNGIENISESIGEYAFAQSADNAHVVLDTLKVNAKTVKSNAFRNMLATRVIIGSRVKSLADAFYLDSAVSTIEQNYDNKRGMLKEVFIEGISEMFPIDEYPGMWATERQANAFYNSLDAETRAKLFASVSLGSALLTKAPIYYDHKYDVTVHAPTCIADGYTGYECQYCGLGTKTDFVPHEGITHRWERSPEHDVEATCAKEGYTTEFCPICESVQKLSTIPRNSNHDFTSTELEPDFDACTKTEYHLRRRCANGCGEWSKNAGKKVTVSESNILGHVYSEEDGGIEQIPATCGKPGQTIKTCSRCYEQNIVETPATGVHLWKRDDTKRIAPTCVANGTNFFNCKNCELTSTEPIPALSYDQAVEKNAHVWVDEIVIKPTRTEYGFKKVYCSLCGNERVGANTTVPKLKDAGMPWWAYVLIGVGGVALVGGIGATVYFAVFKKKNASKSYTYKFNTFKK